MNSDKVRREKVMRHEDLQRLRAPYDSEGNLDVQFAQALGVATPDVRRLYDAIFGDLDDTVYGVRWWAPHPGTSRRIVISHYLIECVRSIETNVVEAALHQLEALDYWDRESDFLVDSVARDVRSRLLRVQMPRRTCPEHDLAYRMAGLHVVGFFRALVGAFDCLGATIVGVSALPTDIRFASLNRARGALNQAQHPLQVRVRAHIERTITDAGPNGWLEWMTEFRNMIVHRGRRWHTNELLPRPVEILGPDGLVIPRSMMAEHLPSDPARSQIEAFLDDRLPPVLTEDARRTLSGALASSLHLINEAASALVALWGERRSTPELLAQPIEQWRDGVSQESTGFTGYGPGTLAYSPAMWISNPDLGRQFRTAALDDDRRPGWAAFD